MHRDLKPQNLLVDKAKNVIKVADLGLGRAFSVPVKSYRTDRHAVVPRPEVLLGGATTARPWTSGPWGASSPSSRGAAAVPG